MLAHRQGSNKTIINVYVFNTHPCIVYVIYVNIYIYTNYLYTWTPGRTKDPCIFSSTAKLLHSFGKECISMVPIENVGSSRGRYILQISLKLHVAKQHIPEVLQRPEFHEHFH